MKIIRLDASALKQSACFLKLWRIAVEGYRGRYTYNDTEFGSAIHVYLKELLEGRVPQEAKSAALAYFIKASNSQYFKIRPKKEHMGIAFLDLVCDKLEVSRDFDPLVVDGEVLVEKNFEIPFYENEDVSIRLTGTIDIIGKLRNSGLYCIGDYKTTSSWNKQQFLEGFEYSVQLPFYLLAIQELARLYPNSIFAEIGTKRIGCFIEGIFLSEKNFVESKRSEIWFYDSRRIQNLRGKLEAICKSIAWFQKEGILPFKDGFINDSCSGKFGYPCEFLGACLAPNDAAEQTILSNSLRQEDYNPLKFRQI